MCSSPPLFFFFPSSTYAFSAFDNQQLQYLWDWKQHNLTIKTGKLFFRANPKLCMSEIRKMWNKTGIQGRFDESDFRNNGDRASCKGQSELQSENHKHLNCYVQFVCWSYSSLPAVRKHLFGARRCSAPYVSIYCTALSTAPIKTSWSLYR